MHATWSDICYNDACRRHNPACGIGSRIQMLFDRNSAFPIVDHRVVVVSSGAIAVGCKRLGLATRPANIAQRQALAAVGQVHLMRFYDDFFSALGVVGLTDLE